MKNQMFIKKELFDTLNVHDICNFSFELNDEIVSPKMNNVQFETFMFDNNGLELNNMGELVKNGIKYGIVLTYTK